MLPEWVSKIEPRTKTPIYALLLMVIPAVIVSYLYAFKIFNFNTLALDATVVIAITFLVPPLQELFYPGGQRMYSMALRSPSTRSQPGWVGRLPQPRSTFSAKTLITEGWMTTVGVDIPTPVP